MPAYITSLSICLWSIPIILFLLRQVKKHSWDKYFHFLLSSVLILLLSFRTEDIGVDTQNYYQSFQASTYLITESYEYTWILICTIVQQVLHADIFWVFFVYAAFTVIPIVYVSKKESVYPFLSLLLYILLFYVFSFNIMRHMAATSMCLLATYYINNNKKIYALIAALIAAALHNTALAFIAVVLLYRAFKNKKVNNNVAIILLFVFLIAGYFLFGAFSYLISLSPIEKYKSYQDYALSRSVNINNIFIMNIANTIWGAFILYIKKDRKDKSWYYKFYILSLFLENLISYHIGANRLIYFFSISSIIFIPNLALEQIKGGMKRVSNQTMQFVSVYIIYLMAWYYFRLLSGSGGIAV